MTSSAGRVQFRVQISGSQAPVASQKGQTAPEGSMMGLSEMPNRVAEVPREMTISPGLSGTSRDSNTSSNMSN
jgi:hypothetical protein